MSSDGDATVNFLTAAYGALPYLSAEEEKRLFKELRGENPLQRKLALERLILSHLKLVVKIAHQRCKSYRMSDAEIEEATSWGMDGLVISIKKFIPDHISQARLNTFAVLSITYAVNDYILMHSDAFKSIRRSTLSGIKTESGKSNKRGMSLLPLMNDLERKHPHLKKDQLLDELGRIHKLSPENLALIKDFYYSMRQTQSLETPIKPGSTKTIGCHTVDQTILQDEAMIADEERRGRECTLIEAFNVLKDDRERTIYRARRLHEGEEPITLDILAEQYRVSRERIRQIETEAHNKVVRRGLEIAARNGQLPMAYVKERLQEMDNAAEKEKIQKRIHNKTGKRSRRERVQAAPGAIVAAKSAPRPRVFA